MRYALIMVVFVAIVHVCSPFGISMFLAVNLFYCVNSIAETSLACEYIRLAGVGIGVAWRMWVCGDMAPPTR